jgi:hypothetical protein
VAPYNLKIGENHESDQTFWRNILLVWNKKLYNFYKTTLYEFKIDHNDSTEMADILAFNGIYLNNAWWLTILISEKISCSTINYLTKSVEQKTNSFLQIWLYRIFYHCLIIAVYIVWWVTPPEWKFKLSPWNSNRALTVLIKTWATVFYQI